MSWNEFLQFLSQPNGIALALGVGESILVEYIPGFGDLDPKWKRIVFLLVCMAVPLAAAGLGIATEGWGVTWQDTFWPAVVAGGAAFGGGTLMHTRKL